MTIEAARRLKDGTVCFVGIGMPSAAANLARLTHAPEVVLIYESGTIGAKPDVLPLSIGDGELAEHADTVVSVPEIFRYWLQGGRVDVGFLGAAQIDRFGNINTTVIGGDYAKPKVRLPGAGGAPEIASNAKEVWIIIKQTKRSFVREAGLPHFGGPPGRRRLAREIGRARQGTHGGDHRPGRARAGSRRRASSRSSRCIPASPSSRRRPRRAGTSRSRDKLATTKAPTAKRARDAARPARAHREGARHRLDGVAASEKRAGDAGPFVEATADQK